VAALSGCSSIHIATLEAKDVLHLEVRQTRSQPHVSLGIAGIAFHSALVVNDPSIKTEGNELQVRIILSPTRQGGSAEFEFPIDIPDQVSTVVFGDARKVIWNRQGGVTR
jgi:hypothetical protein